MTEFAQFLDSAIKLLADRALPVTLVLAAIGGAAMSLWQVAKELFSLHKSFNVRLIKEWAATGTDAPDADGAIVETFMKLVAVGKEATDALYALKTAQLVGQLQAGGRIAVADPLRHEAVLRFLVGATNEQLADRFLNYSRQEASQHSDPAQPAVNEERVRRDIALCRDQVEHYVQRKFDGLQMRADAQWAQCNRRAAIALSILITWIALVMAGQVPSSGGRVGAWVGSGLVAVVAGAIAGFIAPVAKDLVGVVRTLRRR